MSPEVSLNKPLSKRKRANISPFVKSKKKRVCLVEKSTSQYSEECKPSPQESNSLSDTKLPECEGNQIDNSVITTQQKLELKYWGLPEPILKEYESRGVFSMFPWQVECLGRDGVLAGGNLVYSAPTSAGKTLVAEILTIKTVLEKRKKVIIILPFVSVVREKMFYFQGLLGSSGVRVEGLMGGHSLPGGFKAVDIAICTIEKANSLVNRLLEESSLGDVGCVVVDELHLLGDPFRGYLLELLLTKIKYVCATDAAIKVQVVGMSATLPNLPQLAQWLDAAFYQTEFRPVPLQEYLKVGSTVYDSSLRQLYDVHPTIPIPNDQDHVIWLCLETVLNGHSALVFCPTKAWCEKLAQHIAREFCRIGNSAHGLGADLRAQLSYEAVVQVLEHLKRCPSSLDKVLSQTVGFAVAFHHAGMTLEERDIIEGSFRSGTLRVLVATSTLSSGVNLPARRVIVRSPTFAGRVLEAQTYRQMIGRAGRMGRDTAGESFLLSQKNERRLAEELVQSQLAPVKSCLGEGHLSVCLKRAVLEVVASGVACSVEQLRLYAGSTLLALTLPDVASPIATCLQSLVEGELVRQGEGCRYVATPLGQACLAAAVSPDQGLELFQELGRARQCFVLDNDLHIVYQVTPYSVSSQWGNLDWLHMLSLWEELPSGMRHVGELVGVEERFMVRAMRGSIKLQSDKQNQKLSIHRRFYTALALQDLVNEVPLADVAAKFRCSRGMLQSLQQSAATFAGMVTAFCRKLGWSSFELLVSQFQDRLQFGVKRELCDLMRLDALNGPRARALFDCGITTLSALAVADIRCVEDALHKAVPFQTSKELDGETSFDTAQRNKQKHVWVTGRQGLTEREAAELLITEARDLLRKELGFADVKWEVSNPQSSFSDYGSEDSCNGKSHHKPLEVSDIVDKYLSLNKDSRTVKDVVGDERNDYAYVSKVTVGDGQDEQSTNGKAAQAEIAQCAPSPPHFLWPGHSNMQDHSQSDSQNGTSRPNIAREHEQHAKETVTLCEVQPPELERSPVSSRSPQKFQNKQALSDETPFRKNLANSVVVSTPNIGIKDEVDNYFSSPFDLASSSVIVEHQGDHLAKEQPDQPLLFGGSTVMSPIRADDSSRVSPTRTHDGSGTKDSSDMFSSSSPPKATSSTLFSDSLLMDTQLKGVLDSCQNKPSEGTESSPEINYVSPIINKLKIRNKTNIHKNSLNKNPVNRTNNFGAETIKTPLASKSKSNSRRDQRKSSVKSKGKRIVTVSTMKWNSDDENSLDQYTYTEDVVMKTVANISSPWLRSERKVVHLLEPEDLEEFQNSFRVCNDSSFVDRKEVCIMDERKCSKLTPAGPEHSVGECSKSNLALIKQENDGIDEVITDSFLEQAFTTHWDAGNDNDSDVFSNDGNVFTSLSPEPIQKSSHPTLCKKLFDSTGKSAMTDGVVKRRQLSLGMKKLKRHPSTQRHDLPNKSLVCGSHSVPTAALEPRLCLPSKCPDLPPKNIATATSPILLNENAGCSKTPDRNCPVVVKQKLHVGKFKLPDSNCDSGDDDIVLSSQNDSDSNVCSPWKSKSCHSPSFKKRQTKSGTKSMQTSATGKMVSGKRKLCSEDCKTECPRWDSMNIIDVCGHAQLLDTFRAELTEQRCVSFSIACERAPEEARIGARVLGHRPEPSVSADALRSKGRVVVGLAVCFGGADAYYLSLSPCQGKVSLDERLAVAGLLLCGAKWLSSLRVFDCKEQAKVLANCCGLTLDTHCAEDPKVADWLLQPEDKEKNLQAMCVAYAADVARVANLAGPVRGVGSPALSTGSAVSGRLRCCADAVVTWHVAEAQRRLLQERGLLAVYTDVEMPTQLCLARSEVAGLRFCRAEAERLRALLEQQMSALEQQAYQLAGHTFCLTSPADVAKVLYRELRLAGGGKCQAGKQRPSTNKEALLRLKDEHLLPGVILQWRKISATVTKMVFPLLNRSEGERIFGCSITHTATGRISMHEPNLQNIPRNFDISPPEGSHVPVSMRLAFVAGQGRSIISADYSQLELRLLAHFSTDPVLCAILNSGRDVFTSIAASWNKIPEAEVTTDVRQRAKQVCYGMIYGMGTRALAEQLEVDEEEAADFVASFNKAYPGVKQFLQQVVTRCRSVGYVETLGGRRRCLPAISSPNPLLRSHAERQAINTTIQGSAADIAKLAMVRVDSRLREVFPSSEERPSAQLVLHLHDELLYEVSDSELLNVARIVRTNMEAAVSLSVELPVKVRAGHSWGSLVDLDI